MRIEIKIRYKKSFERRKTNPFVLAPNTFLIPISLVLFSAVNAANPNKPRHEIIIANPAKYFERVSTRFSAEY